MRNWAVIIFFVFSAILVFTESANSQEVPGRPDTTTIYQDIESYSGKRKFTKFMYKLVFKPTSRLANKKKPKKKPYTKLIQKPYSAFEGKIIRYIGIETLDPFGYSITDTIVSNQNFLSRTGNNLHLKSQRITIRNLLLIKKNQVFDSLLVKESERLIRSQTYVRDVLFYVALTSKNSDSVDIFIRELDKWSLIPKGSISGSSIKFQLDEKNFMGFGHQFKNSYSWYYTTGEDAFSTKYFIPNIKNTYVNATIQYENDEFGNYLQGVTVDRPFYSPFAKWAGGVKITKKYQVDSLLLNDTTMIAQGFKFISHDYWLGHAIQIFKGNTETDRTTNFIYAVRYTTVNYLEKPPPDLDTLKLYSNERFYMASTGISMRKYVRDKFIFGFGVTEDVPIGKVYSLTGGYREKRNSGQLYLGAKVAMGNYYSWGYFGSNLEYGTFFRSASSREGVITGSVSYFTGLLQVGKWKFRQFVKPSVMIGINRLASDSITIKDGDGLDGFNSTGLSGTNRILISLQTQSYAPWDVLGFKFGPFINYSMGILGDAATGFSNSKVYMQIGFGVLIKNENLVFETFQLSVSFFPVIPGVGSDVLKVNSFKTTDFGFADFEIGKPQAVLFQ